MANDIYNKTNILNLPKVNTINDDDYLIVQNDNIDTQTSLLQFKNFVIDLKNTTFATAVGNLENNVALINNRISYIVDCYNQAINALKVDNGLAASTRQSLSASIIDLTSIA